MGATFIHLRYGLLEMSYYRKVRHILYFGIKGYIFYEINEKIIEKLLAEDKCKAIFALPKTG